MSKRYPLILNGVRFLVNPRHLNVNKPLSMGSLATQKGVEYQVWYEQPEILTIDGRCAGNTAFKELQFLKDNFARTNKSSELYYKNRLYKGIITQLSVDASVDHINEYNYTITFQLFQGEKFAVEDFSLKKGGETTIGAEWTSFKEGFDKTWDDAFNTRPFGT